MTSKSGCRLDYRPVQVGEDQVANQVVHWVTDRVADRVADQPTMTDMEGKHWQ